MDGDTVLNALLVLLFVLIGGVFAGTEMAIVTLRESQVRRIETGGKHGSKTAALVRNPNLFLSAVQIGVTLAGFFSSAYGASTLAPDVAPILEGRGLSPQAADTVALIGMTLIIAYLSLVLGELVPKRLAMQRAVGFTRALAPPLNIFARLMRPVIWLLSVSTNAVVRILGGDPHARTEEVSAEELQQMLTETPNLNREHRRILSDVFSAGDRLIREVMRPRLDVVFLRADLSVEDAKAVIANHPYTRYPVYRATQDDVIGFIHLRDFFEANEGQERTVADLTRPIFPLPGTNKLLPSLSLMRQQGQHMALVVDEYGGTDGIVTLEDLVEELVGEIYDEYDTDQQLDEVKAAALVEGESREIDARLIIEDVPKLIGIELPDDGPYETVAGFIIDRLGRIPDYGDSVETQGHLFEVTRVSDHRVESITVTRLRLP
ncbi:hemolysin family protein [Arthrobacter roseus]|uniref:hemolysin family protein n=1 Tax=Arthrobacter roseus TaxID=136274 RepID=UPI001963532B|nr:hemolysin family protein [Arthrobacter roseus]MBM7849649.1 putative hemolysin [Arthrobacter roseus]